MKNADIATLERRLNEAYERSSLPMQVSPETRAAVEDLSVLCRMEAETAL